MKKLIYIAMLLIVVAALSLLIVYASQQNKVAVTEDSSFAEFDVKGTEVFIYCDIFLQNTYKDAKQVTLFATLPEDVEGGLLREEHLYAKEPDGTIMVFDVPAKSTVFFEHVSFVGDFTGNAQKRNRLLPSIEVRILE